MFCVSPAFFILFIFYSPNIDATLSTSPGTLAFTWSMADSPQPVSPYFGVVPAATVQPTAAGLSTLTIYYPGMYGAQTPPEKCVILPSLMWRCVHICIQ